MSSVIVFLFLFCCFGILLSIASAGWTYTWSGLQIPTMSPPFADLRTVQGALKSLILGFDPQVINPGDPWNRPMNYPMIWVNLAKSFNIQNEHNYLVFVCSMVFFYFSACFCLIKKYPSFWLLFCIFSGASLLAVERGNNDLLIFSILCTSAFSPIAISGLLIFLATLFKIYPVFAIPSILRDKKISIFVILGVAIFMLADIDEILKINAGTPASAFLSYGAASISAEIKGKLGLIVSSWLINSFMCIISLIIFLSEKARAISIVSTVEEKTANLFLIGASIYVFTFVFSSNWDYRLIFLMLCVPYLLVLENKLWNKIFLAAILVASNQFLLSRYFGIAGFSINIFAKCFLFVLLSGIGSIEIRKIIRLRIL